jgi:hypothetical protein
VPYRARAGPRSRPKATVHTPDPLSFSLPSPHKDVVTSLTALIVARPSDWVALHGALNDGDVAVTSAGNLPARYLP